ncbi:MAG: FG-GAP-like repeat-containing protein [Candidatus Zixiibacteriota bacterium]
MRYTIVLFAVILLLSIIGAVNAQAVPVNETPNWNSTEVDMYSTGMVWRDGNNDGWIDVFYSNGNDIVLAPNTIYFSNRGVLPNHASWASANNEYSGHCSVGDIDDDGWPDFAVANYLGSSGFSTANLSNVYMNNAGEISVSPDWFTGDSIYSFSCAFGDADGDGDLDLAFATGDGYNNINITDRIYYNVNGALQSFPGWETAYGTQALDVAWGDIDNDGDLDIAFCYDSGPPALFYNGGGTIETTPSWVALHDESANTIVFGDVNGDDWLDLIVAFNNQLGGTGRYRVYYNDGAGNLDQNYGWQSGTGGYGSALALYDYDHDGDNDLAAGRWFDRPRIYENTGTSFTSEPVWRGSFATVVEEMAWVDVDRNGVENMVDTITAVSGKKLYYTDRFPLYSLDSVYVDGLKLTIDNFCFDPFYGWVSVSQAPTAEIILFYQYSFTNDLTTSNWDTFNYVYPNTNSPQISFSADAAIGQAPLEVTFTDNSIGASDWIWKFGTGDSALVQNPTYSFQQPGVFDVRLDNTLPNGRHSHTELDMIITLADTLYCQNITVPLGDTIICPIYLKNAHALENFTLCLTYAGSLNLQYLDYTTEGCRTDYFFDVSLAGFVSSSRKLKLFFLSGSGPAYPPLAPGDGPVVKLIFAPVYFQSTSTIDTVTISGDTTICGASFFSYVPAVNPGIISTMVCGDTDSDGSVNVGDAVYLINYIFKNGFPPIPLSRGNVNCDASVNVGDAVYLINYIFRGGPEPCCP